MLTPDEEIDMAILMETTYKQEERAYIQRDENGWFYTLKKPKGKADIDFEVVTDVDVAFNIVQKRNLDLAKKRLDNGFSIAYIRTTQ